jgi:hypothetical protein
MPDLAPVESGDFHFVDAVDPEEGVRKMLAIVRERIPKRFGFDPIRDIQVLCPMNRGGLGARSLTSSIFPIYCARARVIGGFPGFFGPRRWEKFTPAEAENRAFC